MGMGKQVMNRWNEGWKKPVNLIFGSEYSSNHSHYNFQIQHYFTFEQKEKSTLAIRIWHLDFFRASKILILTGIQVLLFCLDIELNVSLI